jgi:hypothetical protein
MLWLKLSSVEVSRDEVAEMRRNNYFTLGLSLASHKKPTHQHHFIMGEEKEESGGYQFFI